MYWRTDAHRCDRWVLRAQGDSVARITRKADRFFARVKFAGVDLLGVYRNCADARRFAEGELWSASGEALQHGEASDAFTPCFFSPRHT